MLRTFGVTKLHPQQENRVLFYSILFLILATGIYILTFYIGGEKADGEKQEDQANEAKRASAKNEGAFSFMAGSTRSINFSKVVELPKSFY